MQKYSKKHVAMLEESKKEAPTFCTVVFSAKGSWEEEEQGERASETVP